MATIEEPTEVRARLAWALVWIGVIIFLGTLIWGMLNPHFYMMGDTGSRTINETAGHSVAYETGWNRVSWIWKLWPLWFGGGLLFWGYRRALNESQRQP